MPIKVKFVKDSSEFITGVEITKNNRKTFIDYDKDQGFIINQAKVDPEIYDILKLVYPYPQKQIDLFQEGLYVQADAAVSGGNTTTTLYTIPARYKLYILSGFLTSSVYAVAGAAWGGYLYVYDIIHGASLNLIGHEWVANPVVGRVAAGTVGFINYGFPSGFQVRMYTTTETRTTGGFMGLLMTA